jgi:hypothetical protein
MGIIETHDAERDGIQPQGEMHVKKTNDRDDRVSPSEFRFSQGEDEDELSRLKALATDIREQDDLERDVGRQVFSVS